MAVAPGTIMTRMLSLAGILALAHTGPAMAAPDPARQACLADAHRLCEADVKAMNRGKVRACLITRMAETSPPCHDFMVKARAAALSGQKPEPSAR